jgi:beta-glucosidase
VQSSAQLTFPDGFVWGAATAAYQIEGSVSAAGRGPSIWDTFSHTPGRTRNADTGDIACDHYRRFEEDLDLIEQLGLRAYRFSVAWPRIQPDGKGPANQAGLDFYRRLVDGLLKRGVTPALTLYHWDLPQALEDAGGWTVRDTAQRFAEYAAVVADALTDSVGMWITLNEPWCSSWHGYGHGVHAPGRHRVEDALAANHHLLLGHGLATQALRSAGAGAVGITLNLAPIRPASDHSDDLAAARRADGNLNRMFLDPLFRGAYPPDMVEHYEGRRPGLTLVADGDNEVIAAPLDFLGVNFYFPQYVADPGRLDAARCAGYAVGRPPADPVTEDLRAPAVTRPDVERTAMDWEVEPAALTELLTRVRQEYTSLPIYITENGAACDDYVDPDGKVTDTDRIEFLDGHLRALADAIAAGVDVRGFFVWSLMDNFEWAEGYSKRFGLTWVDYPSGRRLPKASFSWYRDVAAANALPPDSAAKR